jgi:ribonuclease D
LAKYEIINDAAAVEALARELLSEEIVAVDTEADSFYHYFDKTCLIQIATKKHAWLIDTLAFDGPEAMAPLGEMFASPDVRVLFHAAEYDLFVLKRDYGFSFSNLFDTMISAQLLGYPAIGLAALIEHHFGKKLPKDEQRSDWSRRPLTDKQLEYAISDVLYLIRLANKLEKELKKAGRLSWAQTDFETLMERKWPDREFDKLGYLRIKGSKTLDPKSLAVLRELFLMRDARAREIDRPPFKVLGNRALLEIAKAQPKDLDGLSRIKGVTELIIRRMGKELEAAITKGLRKPHGPIPKQTGNGRRRMDRNTEAKLARLKVWRTKRSKELELDPGVLCPNAALESIAFSNAQGADDLAQLEEPKRWFVESFGKEVLDFLGDEALPKEPAKTSGKGGGEAELQETDPKNEESSARRRRG